MLGSKEERAMKLPIILIDNGHGRETPGKRSPDGSFREWAWTREIAARIVEQLGERGVTAFQLVKEETDVSLAARVGRVEAYCREYGKKNIILVSVHCNAAEDGSAWHSAQGWSAYTTPAETDSDELALCLYETAEDCLKGRKIRVYKNKSNPDWEANLYILRKTSCAAVLTENFFMDNHDDVAYLRSEEGKAAIVGCHVQGIIEYIKNEYE